MADLGAPPKFETAQQLYDKADEYFTWIKGEKDDKGGWIREPEPPTITGVTLFLGFESRQSFYDYSEKGDFSYALKKIRTRVENRYEQNLHANNPTGSIFALKNMGWKDKTETEHSGGVEVKTITGMIVK